MRVAAVQMVSSRHVDDNMRYVERAIQKAADSKCELVVLPENFLTYGEKLCFDVRFQQELIEALQRLSQQHCMWLVAGTLPLTLYPESVRAPDKPFATCLVINRDGQVCSWYNKVHLFDADVSDNTGSYRESDDFNPGDSVGLVNTPWGVVGLAVCYDLRFPEYFRSLFDRQVKLICVPSAFTQYTGKAHWEVLVRARAIENQCFVVAANQGGTHDSGRRTWGESMIVNPWGEVVSKSGTGEDVVIADIDFDEVDRLRYRMPISQHRRF